MDAVIKVLILVTSLLGCFHVSSGENILVVTPVAFYSHYSSFQPLLRALAARGHNITVITPFPQNTPQPNLTDIVVPNYIQEFIESRARQDILSLSSIDFILTGIWDVGIYGIERAIQNDKIQKLIKSDADTKFDLIIVETWFAHELFVAFGHKFNAPVVNMMPLALFPSSAYLSGNDFPISYVPVTRSGYTDRMTFMQRIGNVFLYYWDILIGQLYYLEIQEDMMNKYFKYPGSENRPGLQEMLRNTSLTLVDSHFTYGYPTPVHRNLVYYGGAYLEEPGTLPKDLQNLMDNAKEGVIYFSFGSLTTLSSLRPELQRAVLSALTKVKQTVLMRLKEPTLPKEFRNKNIIIRKWFPQAAILAHPNCKLFITHCGIHGIMEALHNAVPMVALPLLFDQHYNSLFLENAGIAYRVTSEKISEKKLSAAISEVLTNPKYKENINIRSAIFKDNPTNIMDNAIYWIEYVIRHKGAPHLRPAVLDLYWYQRLLLDVIAFYLFIALFIIFILYSIFKYIYFFIRYLFCHKIKPKSKKE